MSLISLLEVAIGLAVVYLLASVLCSGINEVLAQEFGRRGRFLRQGLANLIPDRWMFLRVINHPLISSLYRDQPGRKRHPSYIPSANFSAALLDTLLFKAGQIEDKSGEPSTGAVTFADIRRAVIICRGAGMSVADGVLPLLDSADGSIDRARAHLAAWYDSEMERVSGWYKRYSRRVLFMVGIVVAVLCNVDSIQIASSLATSSTLRRSVADFAESVAKSDVATQPAMTTAQAPIDRRALDRLVALENLGLPIGFSCLSPLAAEEAHPKIGDVVGACWHNSQSRSGGAWFIKIIGWLITAMAVSLGGPFWFDLLNRLVDLRAAGRRPAPVAASAS
jgi:hypothetical protein